MSEGEHSASEDSVAAIHQHPPHWKKEFLMADQKKPILEPTTQAFVDALAAQGGKPLYELSYADARRVLEEAQAMEVTKPPADVEEKNSAGRTWGRGRYASIVQRAPTGFCRS